MPAVCRECSLQLVYLFPCSGRPCVLQRPRGRDGNTNSPRHPHFPLFAPLPFWCDCYSIRRVPSLNGYSSTFSAPVACVCVRVVAGGGALWAATVAGREYLVPSGFTGEIYCQSVLALRRGNEQRALFSLPIPFRLGIPSFPGLLCVIVLFFGNGFEGANA